VLARIVVAIDPSASGGEDADKCGIAAGVDEIEHGWVFFDASGWYQPTEWARRAIELYRRSRANRIVAETNFGGGMVEATIRRLTQPSRSAPQLPYAARSPGRASVRPG
jgi:phage terminase large subunit-like protein